MSVEETPVVETVSTPVATTSEPVAAVSEPVAAAEPVAVEPAAVEPEPTPVTHEDFGWDEWDGEGENLPEDVRGWYSKFSERNTTAQERAAQEHATALTKHEAMTQQWRRMYEAQFSGEDDPRISTAEEKASSYERAFDTFKEETQQSIDAIEKESESASSEYYDYVVHQNKDFFGALTEDQRLAITDAIDHMPLHQAVEYAKMGPEVLKEALGIAQQGGNMELVDRLIKLQAQTSRKEIARKPSPASQVVNGSAPTTTPTSVPESALPNNHYGRLQRAAQNAIAASKRK